MMKLQFKFKETATAAARQRVLNTLGERGATGVRHLFPGETDKELATFYVVDCKDEITRQQLLDLLNTFNVVEFAEAEVRRKLIR